MKKKKGEKIDITELYEEGEFEVQGDDKDLFTLPPEVR